MDGGISLLFLTVGCTVLAWFSQGRTNSIKKIKSRGRDRLICAVICLWMVFLCGLRTRYNDTFFYLYTYNNYIVGIEEFLEKNTTWAFGSNFGFDFLQSVIYTLTDANPYLFIMFFSAVTVILNIAFIQKYTDDFATAIYLYITFGTYLLAFAAIKQSFAIAMGLLGIRFAEKKKWILFALIIILAMTVHPYILFFLIYPVMKFKPWSYMTYVSLIFFGIAAISLQTVFGTNTVLGFTSILGEEFSEEIVASGEGLSFFRFLVYAIPLILSFMYRRQLFSEKTSDAENRMINMSIICAEISFVGLFGNANSFGRLAGYFLIFEMVSLPWLFSKIRKISAVPYKTLGLVGYFAYFIYANYINAPFKDLYSSARLSEFFGSFIGNG